MGLPVNSAGPSIHSWHTTGCAANITIHHLAVFLLLTLASISVCAVAGRAEDPSAAPAMALVPELQAGFRFLYEQEFSAALQTFLGWENQHPDDPFGHAAVAASYLFEEFYSQGVLNSDFFLDDKKFLRGIDGKPDPARLNAFYGALDRTRMAALSRMKSNPNDPEAL